MALSFEYKFLKWGYGTNNGPQVWGDMFPVADGGRRQSPIDIVRSSVEEDPSVPPIKAQYLPTPLLLLENTGVSWQLHFHDPDISSLTGGLLQGEYKIVQMHAHWGGREGSGSEHTLEGEKYDAEIHIVHYNTKYGSPGEAFDKEDGLAVLGMLVRVGRHHNEFQKICSNFHQVENPSDQIQLEDEIDPSQFLPQDRSFFTYPGSLTTPPLHESVTWNLFRQPIEISKEQVEAMRSMKSGRCGRQKTCLVDNYRPPCSPGERKVRLCCA